MNATAPPQLQLPLDTDPASGGTTRINGRCFVRTHADRRVVVVHGLPMATFHVDDRSAEGSSPLARISPPVLVKSDPSVEHRPRGGP